MKLFFSYLKIIKCIAIECQHCHAKSIVHVQAKVSKVSKVSNVHFLVQPKSTLLPKPLDAQTALLDVSVSTHGIDHKNLSRSASAHATSLRKGRLFIRMCAAAPAFKPRQTTSNANVCLTTRFQSDWQTIRPTNELIISPCSYQ